MNTNFLHYYTNEIIPAIQRIDIFLKTSEPPLNVDEIAGVLQISSREILHIMRSSNITQLNSYTFYKIMELGSSEICSMFRRELEKGSPSLYSPEDVSYIYGVDINSVEAAFSSLGKSRISSSLFPHIFSKISI